MVVLENHRASMLRALKGQTISVPDLPALLYSDWQLERHEHEAQVRVDLDNNFVPR